MIRISSDRIKGVALEQIMYEIWLKEADLGGGVDKIWLFAELA